MSRAAAALLLTAVAGASGFSEEELCHVSNGATQAPSFAAAQALMQVRRRSGRTALDLEEEAASGGVVHWANASNGSYPGLAFERRLELAGVRGARVIQTADLGYVIAGLANETAGTCCDGFAMKVNRAGVSEWTTRFGEASKLDGALDVVELASGELLLAGVASTDRGPARGLVKLSASGAKIWETSFREDAANLAGALLSLAPLPGGAIILAGYTNASADTDPVRARTGGCVGGCTGVLMKLKPGTVNKGTAVGGDDIEWVKVQEGYRAIEAVRALGDQFVSTAVITNRDRINRSIPTLRRFGNDGLSLWTKQYPGQGTVEDIAVSADGALVALVGSKTVEGQGLEGSFTVVRASDGSVRSNVTLGSSGDEVDDQCYGVQFVKDAQGTGVIAACGMLHTAKGAECDKRESEEEKALCVKFRNSMKASTMRVDFSDAGPDSGKMVWRRVDVLPASRQIVDQEGEIKVGSKVAAYWTVEAENPGYYPATVVRIDGETYLVSWEDNDPRDRSKTRDQLRIIQDTADSADSEDSEDLDNSKDGDEAKPGGGFQAVITRDGGAFVIAEDQGGVEVMKLSKLDQGKGRAETTSTTTGPEKPATTSGIITTGKTSTTSGPEKPATTSGTITMSTSTTTGPPKPGTTSRVVTTTRRPPGSVPSATTTTTTTVTEATKTVATTTSVSTATSPNTPKTTSRAVVTTTRSAAPSSTSTTITAVATTTRTISSRVVITTTRSTSPGSSITTTRTLTTRSSGRPIITSTRSRTSGAPVTTTLGASTMSTSTMTTTSIGTSPSNTTLSGQRFWDWIRSWWMRRQ